MLQDDLIPGQPPIEEDIEEFRSGYRAGACVGTFHQLLEILGWDSWGEPNGLWQVGFLQGYQHRAKPEGDQ